MQPRWMSVGVSVEEGLRCECCMKLCPGERAEACRGIGRLPGLGPGTQTGAVRQASPVLQSWSPGPADGPARVGPTQSRSPKATLALGALGRGLGRKQRSGVKKEGRSLGF